MIIRKIIYQILFIPVICLLMILCVSCDNKQESEGTVYKVYYVNNSETSIFSKNYSIDSTDTKVIIDELINQLSTASEKLEYKAPLAGSFQLIDYTVSEDQLILNFDENYKNQEVTTEILVRAAVVRTLTQIKDIRFVSFQLRSEPLTDAAGNAVGVLSADMFIDNAGNEINTYENVRLRLYFANEAGDKLVVVNRPVLYNSNISMERLVVEQLIAGPKEDEKAFSVITPSTKIISVNVKDGICYLDLDENFLDKNTKASTDVTLYSLANSLIELDKINKIQISVKGKTTIKYKDKTSLETIFERNLDLVEQ